LDQIAHVGVNPSGNHKLKQLNYFRNPIPTYVNKKLSYRRETERQLRMFI